MILAKRETQAVSPQVNHRNLLQGVLFWDELRSTLAELRRQELGFLPREMVGFQTRMEQCVMAYEVCLGTHTHFTEACVSQVQAKTPGDLQISFPSGLRTTWWNRRFCITGGYWSCGPGQVASPHWAPSTFRLTPKIQTLLMVRNNPRVMTILKAWASNHCTLAPTNNEVHLKSAKGSSSSLSSSKNTSQHSSEQEDIIQTPTLHQLNGPHKIKIR